MQRNRGKHLKDKEYRSIKALLEYGVPINQVTKVTGRSWNLISEISRSNNIEHYHIIGRERAAKSLAKKQLPVKEENRLFGDEETDIGTEILGALTEVLKGLSRMNDKLDKLIERR